jgi:hypothetical protein
VITTLAKCVNLLEAGGLLFTFLVGCLADGRASSKVKEAIALEERENHVVIGRWNQIDRRDQDTLEYVDLTDVTSSGVLRTVPYSERQQVATVSVDLREGDEVKSNDRKWTAHCSSSGQCEISNIGDLSKSFVVSRKNILTPLYWSPDERFVFFVRKVIWTNPMRCMLEDVRDVTVYDLAQRAEEAVTTVCDGYPYGALRWFKLY